MIYASAIIFIIYAAVIIYVVKIARKRKNPRLNRYIALAFFFGFLVYDIPPGYITFSYLCKQEAGAVVYQPLHVSGYAQIDNQRLNTNPAFVGISGCRSINRLIDENFEYLEVEVNNPNPDYFVDTKGKYRCTLEKIDSPLCDRFNSADLKAKERWFHAAQSYGLHDPSQYCVSLQPIKSFQSRYLWTDDDAPFWMTMLGIEYTFDQKVVDTETGNITAKYFYPRYSGGWFKHIFLRSFETGDVSSKGCQAEEHSGIQEYMAWLRKALSSKYGVSQNN